MSLNINDDLDWITLQNTLGMTGTFGFYLRSDNDMQAEHNGNGELFCASAFKGFVLAECLRQCENGQRNLLQTLTITDDVKSPGGEGDGKDWSHKDNGTRKHLQDALNAMIEHSDNTATDMVLNLINPESVRKLIHDLGLIDVVIPDSTRKFMHELFGLQYDVGWVEFQKLMDDANDHLKINPFHAQQRMAASAKSLVDFYSQAETLFKTDQFKEEFRNILRRPQASADLADRVGHALGKNCSVYVKGGSIGIDIYNVLSIAGWAELSEGYSPRRFYFSLLTNFTNTKWRELAKDGQLDIINFMSKKMAKVIGGMLAGGFYPPIDARLTTN